MGRTGLIFIPWGLRGRANAIQWDFCMGFLYVCGVGWTGLVSIPWGLRGRAHAGWCDDQDPDSEVPGLCKLVLVTHKATCGPGVMFSCA
eukprot:366014-Chlamydomonas_euryale.AAC.2